MREMLVSQEIIMEVREVEITICRFTLTEKTTCQQGYAREYNDCNVCY